MNSAPGQGVVLAAVAPGRAAIPVRNLWHMLLYAWREYQLVGSWQAESEAAPDLEALLARVLMDMVRQRMRIGLGRGYEPEVAEFRGIRGRIDFAASLRRLAFENGRAVCRFTEYDIDTPRNRIIRSTLARLASQGEFGASSGSAVDLREQLRATVRDLEGIRLIELRKDLIHRQALGRNDSDYRLMLTICELLLERRMPTETSGLDQVRRLDRDRMTLSRIYERFVASFYQHHLADWVVRPQTSLHWPVDRWSDLLPGMRPDLVLEHPQSGDTVVLDTKFTAKSLIPTQFREEVLNSAHLYQIYAYLRTQDELNPRFRGARGILLYPTVSRHLSDWIDMQGHRLQIETVDLAEPWPLIETRLLGIIREGAGPASSPGGEMVGVRALS